MTLFQLQVDQKNIRIIDLANNHSYNLFTLLKFGRVQYKVCIIKLYSHSVKLSTPCEKVDEDINLFEEIAAYKS